MSTRFAAPKTKCNDLVLDGKVVAVLESRDAEEKKSCVQMVTIAMQSNFQNTIFISFRFDLIDSNRDFKKSN